MASTGDLRNNIAKLQTELKYLRYAGPFEVSRFPHVSDHCLAACLSRPRILVTFGHTLNSLLFEQYSLSRGDPAAFLPLMHFIFLESDPALAAHFAHLNHSLTAKRDSRFVESVWKLLRDVFDFKPVLSKEQFLSDGFAEHKMLLLTEIAHLCKKMGVDLARRKDRKSTRSVPESTQAQPKAGLSASSITPRLPINASWNQQTSVNTISNTDTIKNNSHQGHQVPASKSRTAAVPRVPQQALDPTIYSSFDILDGLNQSYPASVHLNQFHASLNAKKIESDALQRQIRMLEDLPYSALNGTDRRFLRQRSSGSAMQTEINGIDAWGQFGELMPSGKRHCRPRL
ncbi:Centrosomal spindle body, CEP44-domain-containing protein [Chytriomyces sp. MP71]|nr:Centrosomal spindle body, CEP44-domain-containing protein [Chytriomyces sp. MP71]